MSHQLKTSWTVWHHSKLVKDQHWGSSMNKVCDFSTLEEFWIKSAQCFNPSAYFAAAHAFEVDGINAISVFKEGIRPEWEDPANLFGAELVCRTSLDPGLLDLYWEIIVLALIGESIDSNDSVCGCRLVDKTNKGNIMFKIEIWLRTQDLDAADNIKKRILKSLSSHGKCDTHNTPKYSKNYGIGLGLLLPSLNQKQDPKEFWATFLEELLIMD
eukprot:gene6709-13597_t